MLFNSPEFIFLFLPLCLVLFFNFARHFGNQAAIAVLVVSSLFFYAWWKPAYLLLLLLSMLFNYFLGKHLGKVGGKAFLVFGISVNLILLAYYKYAGFILFNLNNLFDTHFSLGDIILPLAISFYTFQQIAYLIDSYQGKTKEYRFLHYALFVSFFPQLIAGPIVHHKEMLPQFASSHPFALSKQNLIIGLSIFSIGLFKKTVLADGIALYANPVFAAADTGTSLDFFSAWGGALAYTFQLYFDFSGYSDMALGLARMFGIILPLNFYSPYKAANISEFWRRWHMTLSRFLRDYLYIPLGGNRVGPSRRYTNLMITMLLGGLWHGAGWNFVIWGALHGAYLSVSHAWAHLMKKLGLGATHSRLYLFLAWLLTMFAVVIGWVFFRATTLDGAMGMLQAMVGGNGIALPQGILSRMGEIGVILKDMGVTQSHGGGSQFVLNWCWVAALMAIALVMPNVQDIFGTHQPSLSANHFERKDAFWPIFRLGRKVVFIPSTGWAIFVGVLAALSVLTLFQVSEFLYFQF
ncbi:MBOAT family O-acyltransferase [Bowmanella dokdonensis]|uniref:Probable alginate O-acetylase n=1 Tax=Bowmanella dokdonensis TaxID=751969 RepID=A0A939DRF7_9ALTE|nr:MBOAT family protein [Bowmanella dokdonensis]MBN7827303.1 MBOAT family protein [Bowmanella dokdonensis]